MSQFSWGADPEFMLVHNNELKSAISVLPKKENAIVKHGHEYYFDNVLAEIAIKPAKNKDEAISHVHSALYGLAQVIQPAKFVIRASDDYPKKELNCLDAKIAGCNPEWNVYSLEQIFPPDEDVDLLDGYYQFKTPFRSAGGHIHIGSGDLQDHMKTFNVIRMMDLFLGIPSVFMDTDDTSKDRRSIYGHAGSHRMPDYGLEYRALGNFWLSSPEHVSLMYDLTEFVMNFVDQKYHEKFWTVNKELLDEEDPSLAYSCFGYDVNLLRKAIDTSNRREASLFMTFISNYLPIQLLQKIDKLSNKFLPDPYLAWGIQ